MYREKKLFYLMASIDLFKAPGQGPNSFCPKVMKLCSNNQKKLFENMGLTSFNFGDNH